MHIRNAIIKCRFLGVHFSERHAGLCGSRSGRVGPCTILLMSYTTVLQVRASDCFQWTPAGPAEDVNLQPDNLPWVSTE